MSQTFSQLLAWIQAKLDDPKDITWKSDDKKSALNEAFKDLFFQIAETQPSIYVQSVDINVGAGTHEYKLPADFGKFYGYPYIQHGWHFDIIEYHHRHHHHSLRPACYVKGIYSVITPPTDDDPTPVETYPVIGFLPHKLGNLTVKVDYIPSPPTLTADDDVFPIDPMWSELVVLGACIRLMETKTDDSRYPRIADRWKEQMIRFKTWLATRSRETDLRFQDHFEG